jgi:serine/threonine-protein kinase
MQDKRVYNEETFILSDEVEAVADVAASPEKKPPHVPKRIGDYVTKRVLGVGGMGAVYHAEHVETKRQVALKVIGAHLLRNRNAERRFENEASAISRIDHPNVIKLVDFGHLPDGTLFYAMEYLEGTVLTSVLRRRGKMTPAEAQPFVHQICAGLQAAHDCGVIHRDLKPDNVFVVGEDPVQLKVFDFGVAKLLDQGERLTATGIMVGTPLYFAPEQAMGQAEHICPQTDLYALGVMMYGMLTGEFPFYSQATAQLVLQHVSETPPPLRRRAPGVPEGVAKVVHWCLEKDPTRRPLSAMALAIAFSAAVESVSVDTKRRTLIFNPPRGSDDPPRPDSQRRTIDFRRREKTPSGSGIELETTKRRQVKKTDKPADDDAKTRHVENNAEEDDKRTRLRPPRPPPPPQQPRANPPQANQSLRTDIYQRSEDPSSSLEPPVDQSPIYSIDLVRVPLTPAADPPLPMLLDPPRSRRLRSGLVFAAFGSGVLLLSILTVLFLLFILE